VDRSRRRSRAARALRLAARGWSVASVTLLLGFIVGEGVDVARLSALEAAGFLFFPVGLCVGMAVAWRRPALGGGITVGSLAAFYVLHRASAGAFPRGAAWLAFAAPGFLFLTSGLLSRGSGSLSTASPAPSRPA
jgi:hypothetical protein